MIVPYAFYTGPEQSEHAQDGLLVPMLLRSDRIPSNEQGIC